MSNPRKEDVKLPVKTVSPKKKALLKSEGPTLNKRPVLGGVLAGE